MKSESNRLREWTKEIRRELELERNKETRGEKIKTKVYQKNEFRGDTKINKMKKWRNKEEMKNLWEIEERDFSRIFIFI